MTDEAGEAARRVTVPVFAAAALLALLAGRQFARRVLPLFPGREAEAGARLADIAFLLIVAWGLLRLRPWAWWAATLFTGVGVFTSLLVILTAQASAFHRAFVGFHSPAGAALLVGAACLVAFVLLLLPSSRSAFRR